MGWVGRGGGGARWTGGARNWGAGGEGEGQGIGGVGGLRVGGARGHERFQNGTGCSTKTEPVVLPKRNRLYYQNRKGGKTKKYVWSFLRARTERDFLG
jgi:hypothetical protein